MRGKVHQLSVGGLARPLGFVALRYGILSTLWGGATQWDRMATIRSLFSSKNESSDRTRVLTDQTSIPGSDGEHRLQEKYGRTTHAMAFYKHQVLDHLNTAMQAFLARQEMMFVGTADAKGHADSAFRCGHAGFVKVLDERTVAYPEYRGNGVMASLGNISENPHVGLLFIDFGEQIGLHINGGAKIVENTEFLEFLKDHPAEQAVLGDAVLKDIIESDGGHLERWVMVE